MEDLIDFNIIEGQKENIQSLPSGRSARTLANLYSVSPLQPLSTPTPADTTNLNDAMRREYEAEVANLSESDDPLDIYDRYVNLMIHHITIRREYLLYQFILSPMMMHYRY